MAFAELRAWVLAVVAIASYTAYAAIILGRAGSIPITEVHYVSTLLWTIGAAIVASIVLSIVLSIVTPVDTGKGDERDRQINRFGEYTGQSLVIVGGVAALLMALAEVDYFWIANAIYLAFTLSAVLGSTAKIVVYRRGFPGL